MLISFGVLGTSTRKLRLNTEMDDRAHKQHNYLFILSLLTTIYEQKYNNYIRQITKLFKFIHVDISKMQ